MDRTQNHFLSIGLGVALGLLSIHCGEAAKLAIIAGSVLIAVISVKHPEFGILAAFPLLVVIQPTPPEPGWREFCFTGVLVVSSVASAWQSRETLWADIKRARYCILFVGILILCNFFTARVHNVCLNDWTRGLLPFAFLGFSLPVYLECRRNSQFIPWIGASLVLTSSLFCWLVGSYYISEQLWRPYHYVMDHGKWFRIRADQVALISQPVFEFRARITQVLQQSTDVMLPASFVCASGLILWGRRAAFLVAGAVILTVSTAAIVLTYTRSMLLAALLVSGVLAIVRLSSKRGFLRALGIAALSGASALVTIQAFDLVDIYLNRYLFLKQASGYFVKYLPNIREYLPSVTRKNWTSAIRTSGGARLLPKIEDENITTRLEEYRLAYGMFLESPLIGQGFGARHKISFATGHGDVIVGNVSYVHNWIFYFLKVGGLTGVLAWSAVLLGPAAIALYKKDWASEMRWSIIATVLLFAIYGLFFAVFRLVTFNLVLGALWGLVVGLLVLSSKTVQQKDRD